MTCHVLPRLNITWRSTSCAIEAKKISARVLISILGSRFYAFKDNRHDRLGQTGKVIIAVPVAIGKDPRGYYLIHGSEEAMGRNGDRNIGPKDAGFLAFAQDSFDYVKVFNQQAMGKLAQKLGAMPKFSLENDGQAAV